MADDIQEYLVRFRTLEDAARQGLIKALRSAGQDEIEWGGAIYRDPTANNFYLSHGGPMQGTKDNIEITGRKLKLDDVLAAAYHSHPPKDVNGMFSEKDVAGARQVGIPFYMGQASNMNARVYDPAHERRRARASVRSIGQSPGKPFMEGFRMEPEQTAMVAALREGAK